MADVILVAGPPCAGKTTYVAQRAAHGDLVLDQDVLGASGMRDQLRAIDGTAGTAWVIRCAPGPRRRAGLAHALGATDTVLLVPAQDLLIARARLRPQPRGQIAAIRRWFADEALDRPPGRAGSPGVRGRPRGPQEGTPSAGRRGRPYRRAKARLHAKTQVCWLCGHAGAYELDHDPPRVVLLASGLDPNDERYHRAAHGTSCPCPTCGQRCNQVKGASTHRRPRMTTDW